jgi:cAMP phosphodiesterase
MSGERMKVRILGSAPEQLRVRQFASSYLINDRVAIDAGCLGFYRTPQEQCQIRHVFLTHCHADHIASLPIFLENVHASGCECPVVYGQAHTLESLQRHVFNDVIWPDFIGLGARTQPFVRLQELQTEEHIEVEGLRILPAAVHHVVPTFGYLVSEGEATVVFGGDSGPTDRVWALARQAPSLRAVFLEASFPNSMRGSFSQTLPCTASPTITTSSC